MDINYKELIKDFIIDSEDYPSMQEFIDHFWYLGGEQFATMFMQTLELQKEGQILYDNKHDAWIRILPYIKTEIRKMIV